MPIFVSKKIVERLRLSALNIKLYLLLENSFHEPMIDLNMARIRFLLNYESLQLF